MEREEIQRVFNRDFRKLIGVDVYAMADQLEFMAKQDWWFETMSPAVKQPLALLGINLLFIIEDFLTYDQEKFPNPLDQYIYIYENKENILKILECNLEIESPFDDPVAYHPYVHLREGFERMFTALLTCGNTHKFDPEMCRSTLERDGED